jgi:hypothetical protein
MKTLQQFQATDPRDLIYAFLAFELQDTKGNIKPDYKSSVAKVWITAASSMVTLLGLSIYLRLFGVILSLKP